MQTPLLWSRMLKESINVDQVAMRKHAKSSVMWSMMQTQSMQVLFNVVQDAVGNMQVSSNVAQNAMGNYTSLF